MVIKRMLTGFALSLVLCGQTQVPVASVAWPATTLPYVQVVTSTGSVFARLDPSIVLDTSGPIPLLRAVLPKTVTLIPRRTEVFQPGVPWTTVTVSLPPNTADEFLVYRNGMLMAPVIDYSTVGRVVTFTPLQGPAPADVLQVSYRPI